MIKKNYIFILLLVISLILIPNNVFATGFDEYFLNNYDINIIVNEDNTLKITENIGAYFRVSKHGIFRKIPLKNKVTRLDGTTSYNRAKISEINVSDKYTISTENGYRVIKIGDANRTLTGQKNYVISYLYNLGKDTGQEYDELYFNLIGSEWDTSISNITFTITMPKEFDESKLGVSSGRTGSTDSSYIEYKVNGNVITGKVTRTLYSGEALTVRLELPEGYFVGANSEVDNSIYLMFIIPIIFLIISIIMWYKYGKDNQVIETVEFYPPEGFNSLEVGFLYKGKATNQDVTSLLVYLANKGYIKIKETEEKSLFTSKQSFKIIKLKEYDGNNIDEEMFLNGLFNKRTGLRTLVTDNNVDTNLNEVTSEDLYNNFYLTMNKIIANINNKENKNKIFEKSTFKKKLIIVLLILISLIVSLGVPTLSFAGFSEFFPVVGMSLFYAPFFAIGILVDMPLPFKIFWLGFTSFHAIGIFSTLPIADAFMFEPMYLIGFIFGILCIIGMLVVLKYMPKRTEYGNQMLGKLRGFKNFLETAEKSRLEAMVLDNPSYFYDILPYTYVLGVSDKWIKKFETIALQAPDWYDSPTGFSVNRFGTFMNNTMSSAKSAMSSSPSSSSGGSSGGGSSGGGSGGGGGGSW